jgi:hypothetical protein
VPARQEAFATFVDDLFASPRREAGPGARLSVVLRVGRSYQLPLLQPPSEPVQVRDGAPPEAFSMLNVLPDFEVAVTL